MLLNERYYTTNFALLITNVINVLYGKKDLSVYILKISIYLNEQLFLWPRVQAIL